MRSAQRFEGEHNAVWRGMGFLVAEAEELPLMDPDTALVAQEQLRKLARRNKKGTREEAVQKNVKHVDRAKKAARSLPAVDAFDKVKIQAVGRGSLEVRKAVEKGALPPEPFATHGAQGWTGGDNPSWWREWCRAGHRQRDACGRGTDGDRGAVSTMVADGGSSLSDEAARAVRATRSGLKPSHVALPTELKADGTACEGPRRENSPGRVRGIVAAEVAGGPERAEMAPRAGRHSSARRGVLGETRGETDGASESRGPGDDGAGERGEAATPV